MRSPAATYAYRSKRGVTTGLQDRDVNIVGPHPAYLAVALLVLLAVGIARARR